MLIQRNLRLVAGSISVLLMSLSPALLSADTFTQTNLVSDIPGLAATTDPNLKNPWGMSSSATSPFWISDQVTGVATLYNGAGNITPLVVTVPGGSPTGQVFNFTNGFALPGGGATNFIFATLKGTIAAWSAGSNAVTVANTPGAVFTGLALASSGGANFLYAANTSQGLINVFNSSYQPVNLPGNFVDPNLPAGFTPYNIQLIGSTLFVTYTEVGGSAGIVDEFGTDGNFIKRLISPGGPLDAPWGITLAPSGFGSFGDDLLVGNLGNGEINAFDPTTGAFIGTLDGSNGQPLVNSGLWALDFRTGGANINPDALYFTAGINNQQDGLFGEITPSTLTPEPASFFMAGLGVLALGLLQLRHQRA